MKSKFLRFLWKLAREIGSWSAFVVGALMGVAAAYMLLYTTGTIVHLLGFGRHQNALDLGGNVLGPIVLVFFAVIALWLVIHTIYEWLKELWKSS